MYHTTNTTATTTSRHRVVSVDAYWAPGNSSSTLAADVLTDSTRRDTSVPRLTADFTSMQNLLTTTLHHLPSSADPTLRPRRSHRPRGCRGGRKNRKAKLPYHDLQQSNSPPYRRYDASCGDNTSNQQYRNVTYHYNNEASMPLFPTTDSAAIVKGDLSPYQHLKISNKPWQSGLYGMSNRAGATMSQPLSIKQQMLPPPVPSALFDSHRQNIELMTNHTSGSGLKMLPSFDNDELDDGREDNVRDDYNQQCYDSDDDDDDSSESIEFGMIIPKPPQRLADGLHMPLRCGTFYHKNENRSNAINLSTHHPNNNNPCGTTVDTCCTASLSRSRTSSSSSDDSAMVTTDETNLMTTHNSTIHKLQPPNHTFLKSQPTPKMFVLPTFHLHITPPTPPTMQQNHQHPTPNSATNFSSGSAGSGFGSLFVTSPRSFLFGIGRGARHTQSAHIHK